MSVSRRLRYEILRRDDHACRYCGAKAPDVPLTVDHVLPEALGGTDDPANLVTACKNCNAGKSSVAPDSAIVEGVSDDALRWAAALAEVAKMQASARKGRREFIGHIDDVWLSYQQPYEQQPAWRPDSWQQSATRFYELGLSIDEAHDAIANVMTRDTIRGYDGQWKYFCGICWGILRERQELARQMLDEAGDC